MSTLVGFYPNEEGKRQYYEKKNNVGKENRSTSGIAFFNSVIRVDFTETMTLG